MSLSIPTPTGLISRIVINPNICSILKSLLNNNGWSVNDDNQSDGFLDISKNGSSYLLYLFFGDGYHDVWLADEEEFNGDAPMWFSPNSCLVSPMCRLRTYRKPSSEHELILVMMPPTYIVNADDEIDNWHDVMVLSLKRLKQLIGNGGILDYGTLLDDVGQQSADDDNRPIYYQVDSESYQPKVNSVRMGVQSIIDGAVEAIPSTATYFRRDSSQRLVVWADIDDTNSSTLVLAQIMDSDDNALLSDNVISYNGTPNLEFDISSLSDGEYELEFSYDLVGIYSTTIHIQSIPSPYTKAINLETFGIYRMDKGKEVDYSKIIDSGAMRCFNIDDLEGLLIVTGCSNVIGSDYSYQFIVKIYSELGQVIYEECNISDVTKAEQFGFAKEVRDVVCAQGAYRVKVEFYGEVIAEAQFTVGQRDIRANYNVKRLKPRANVSGKGTALMGEVAPMATLNAMVGLTSVKEQIAGLAATFKMNNRRTAMGLPIKQQRLHCAFLGNPGTGKTTVAKLLGQIYKDIGVLSKGHVVIEERSTLMTQSWGGEGEMVNNAIEKSRGGILFIDEAYDLITSHPNDPGRLIVSALLTAMDDEKNRDWMVIFAGYTQEMEKLISVNPGLESRMTKMYFHDYNHTELMQIADFWLNRNCYTMTDDARQLLSSNLLNAYNSRGDRFGNARYVGNVLENEVLPAMAKRVIESDEHESEQLLTTIERCDIPSYVAENNTTVSFDRLDKMVGLNDLKQRLSEHLSFVRFLGARRDNNIHTHMPPLHMVFTGNPGTGKSSVADYIGEIYRSMGILSVGNVIKVTRADIVDNIIGGTEKKMKELLVAAHGNILFIDEAYALAGSGKDDFGSRAMEVLLDSLGKESCDFIVVMAGYPAEMESLLASNVGLKGRFPYTFHFEDYSEQELLQIADSVAERNNLTLSEGARSAISALIKQEYRVKDGSFSNARFVVRLITTQIMTKMASRLNGVGDKEALTTVLAEDVPILAEEVKMISDNLFDEDAISEALAQLDAMVGLAKVKSAIHQFVDFSRRLNVNGTKAIDDYPLKWSFIGNSGTGKSTVAEILSQILKAMHLIAKGHTVEIKAEEIYGVSTHLADEIIKRKMNESKQGLLFVDGDAPQFKGADSRFNPDYLRMCLAANTSEIHGHFAVVIAENDSPRVGLARNLSHIGIHDFDHTLIFDDYNPTELMAILNRCLDEVGLSLDSDAELIVREYINSLYVENQSLYANARTMRLLATTIHKMAIVDGCVDTIVTGDMVEEFKVSRAKKRNKIGF